MSEPSALDRLLSRQTLPQLRKFRNEMRVELAQARARIAALEDGLRLVESALDKREQSRGE